MEGAILAIISQLIEEAIVKYAKWEIQRKIDKAGNAVSEFVALFDDDNDGTYERQETIFSFDVSIPEFYNGYALVNDGDQIGLGLPEYEIVDSSDFTALISDEQISGNGEYYLIDDDVYAPLPFDFNGDGQLDWGKVVDRDDNGIPDASDDAPFFLVGSDGYKQIMSAAGGEKSFIIVSADGSVSVYDPNGDLTEQDYNQAYTLWIKDNGALDKPFKYYSVTEALLLIVALFAGVSLVGKLFKRRVF